MQIKVICPGEYELGIYRDNFFRDSVILEQVYCWFNSGSGKECPEFLADRTMRSLSVNDFVGIDDNYYQCCGDGWRWVSKEYVGEVCKEVKKRLIPKSAWRILSELESKKTFNKNI